MPTFVEQSKGVIIGSTPKIRRGLAAARDLFYRRFGRRPSSLEVQNAGRIGWNGSEKNLSIQVASENEKQALTLGVTDNGK